MQPNKAIMMVTANWALNGDPNLGFTLAQLSVFSIEKIARYQMAYSNSYIFENGSPPSREKAQNTLPVPIKTLAKYHR